MKSLLITKLYLCCVFLLGQGIAIGAEAPPEGDLTATRHEITISKDIAKEE